MTAARRHETAEGGPAAGGTAGGTAVRVVGPEDQDRAVDLWGLMGGPAFVAIPVRGIVFDQYLDNPADAFFGALCRELFGQCAHLRDAPGYLDLIKLAIEPGGLRALLVGISEHTDGVEASGGQELGQLGQVGLGLTGETDDEVRPDAGVRCLGTDQGQQSEEPLPVAESAHPA